MDTVLESRKVISAALCSIGIFEIKPVSGVQNFVVLQYSVLHVIKVDAVPSV